MNYLSNATVSRLSHGWSSSRKICA